MSELRELYQEVILDHYKRPRNFGAVSAATHAADGDNPLCGDQIHITAHVQGGRVVAVGFDGSGCAISTASASLMTEAITGRTLAEVEEIFETFHGVVTGSIDPEDAMDELGKLAVLSGVRDYPVRIKCATLAWHTMKAALEGNDAPVTTE